MPGTLFRLVVKKNKMRAYGQMEIQLHSFLTSMVGVVSFTPRPLYPQGK
jgi:hypothetical protein